MKKFKVPSYYYRLFFVSAIVVPILLGFLSSAAPSNAEPLLGQIIVDPNTPRWLVYNRDTDRNGKLDPFFMAGPGDPEDFLYRGTRNADGTRNGDQMSLINKLKGTGANSIYLMAWRGPGGDGGDDENPFIDSDPSNPLDQDILDQWEQWFTEMDNNGIVIYFFIYDDDSAPSHFLFGGDTVGDTERAFIEGIVNKFEHHKNLIWAVKEEYFERLSTQRVSDIAAVIRAADDYDHVIASHDDFSPFTDDPNIDQYAIQFTGDTSDFHSAMVSDWNTAAGRYNLNMAEGHPDAFDTLARERSWAVAMGGAYVMHLRWKIDNNSISELEDAGRLVSFMESTNFNEMAPHDELAFGGTEYVLAKPGESYIAYALNLSGNIGLQGMTADTYDFTWLDVTNGTTVIQININVPAGDQSWSKPFSIGNELAVYITRTGIVDTTPPTTPIDFTATAKSASQIDLSWSASSDPESGIASYQIYRDGTVIRSSTTTSFSDTGLTEATTYTYDVSAVNGAGLESAKSTPVSATTLTDTTPPTILSVSASGEPTQVTVLFSEPVETVSATNVANYSIDNGIIISGASLGADLATVTLTTSPHSDGLTYTLTVNSIKDRASSPNSIAPNSQLSYTFVAQLVISNLTVASGRPYEIVPDGFQNGAVVFIDRGFTYSNVPPALQGATYIKTANDDTLSQGDQFLSFEVNQDVTVYIAHDDTYKTKPNWLAGFVDTGQGLVIAGVPFSLFQKTFPAGTVTLGGNVHPTEAVGNTMYSVIIIGQGGLLTDTTPPATPTGLTVE